MTSPSWWIGSSSTPVPLLLLLAWSSLLLLLLLLRRRRRWALGKKAAESAPSWEEKEKASSASSEEAAWAAAPLPPGPRAWPIIGNLLQVGVVPHEGLRELNRRYGPIVFVKLGAIPHVVTDEPAVVREFLKVQDHVFASRPSNVILAELLTYGGKDIGFAPYGAHWRKMRKICSLELFAPRRLEGFQGLRAQEMRHILEATCETAEQGRAVDLRDTFNWLTSNMMTRMLLGKRYFGPGDASKETAAKLKGMIAEGILMMNGFNISDYLPFLRCLDIQGQERRMKQIMEHINNLATSLIAEMSCESNQEKKKKKKSPECFAEVLLSLGELTEDVVKAVMVDMMAAGTDTPAVSTEWAMAEVLADAEVMRRVRAEVDAVVGRERLVEEADLPRLRYLRAVLKESFRLHPVGAILIPHLAMRDALVCGYRIPQHTRVLINVFSLNRNPAVWPDRPDQFCADRHLRRRRPPPPQPHHRQQHGGGATASAAAEEEEEVEFIEPECRLIPFGAGRRMCPAASLGLTMVLMALATMVHAFDWSLPPSGVDMARAPATMVRAVPLTAYARPRLPRHLYYEHPIPPPPPAPAPAPAPAATAATTIDY